MKRKLNKLSVAVAAALAVGAVGQAQATDVLLPYVAVSDSVTTLVSVLNPNTTPPGAPVENFEATELHYRLWYKAVPNADVLLAPCEEVDVFRPTSPNDIQTIDLGAKLTNDLGVVFNDPSVRNQWKQNGLSYALAEGLPPLRGWLLIDDATQNPAITPSGISLLAEAFLFEYATGAAWGYEGGAIPSAFQAPLDSFRNPLPLEGVSVAFNGIGLTVGETAVSVFPFGEAFTYFFVTPLLDDMRAGNNNLPGGGPPAVARVSWGLTDDPQRTAMWDRDENPVSGARNIDVRCVGRVKAEDMLSSAALLRVPNGGWGWLRSTGRSINPDGSTTANPSVGMSVLKLEFNDGSREFAGTAAGTFNNSFLLRNTRAGN